MKTEIIRVENAEDPGVERGASLIRSGKTVVFPTETVYGLGADALNAKAVENIYRAKGRPADNPLIVHIAEYRHLFPLVKNVSLKAKALIAAYWPGPLTIIFEKSALISDAISGGLDTVAVRIPSNPIAHRLIAAAGVPVAAPSANISGRPSGTHGAHVVEDLDGKVDAILYAADSDYGLESTVLDLSDPQKPMLLRPGVITVGDIERIIGSIGVNTGIDVRAEAEQPRSPGMKYTHYSPSGEVVVVKGDAKTEKIKALIADAGAVKIGVLACDETADDYSADLVLSLGSREHPGTMEHNLFACLREFDARGTELIYAEDIALNDNTLAIVNRLYKAAGFHFIES